jgi:uncharacterized repeat protein (TIGR01451 family)
MRRNGTLKRPLPRRSTTRRLLPAVERVEDRVLLATFTVINTTDTTSPGSLRWAIGQSNATPGSNTINFNIANAGVQTIAITSALPAITVPVTIDGATELGTTLTPTIELDGAGAGSSVDGLDVVAGGTTIEGLAINRFTGEGINLSVLGNDTIEDDFIGTDPSGTIAEGNGLDGILVQVNSDNNTILGNLISGNVNNGIYLNGQQSGASNPVTSGNLIVGNAIGTDVTGTKPLGNENDGITVQNATLTTIGGTTVMTRNIISGNGTGVELFDFSDGSVVEGNYIGTDLTGEVALGNNGPKGFFNDNLVFRGISNSTIGGTAAGAGNVISGGSHYGIDSFVIGSQDIAIEGNLIGTDAKGTKALGNASGGLVIAGPSNVTVGGTVAGARNVISGNGSQGGAAISGRSTGLVIEGNYIGTDITGTLPIGNGGDGIDAGNDGTVIGGPSPQDGNIIANNGGVNNGDGVNVTSKDTPVLSNSIDNNHNLGIALNGGNNGQPAPVLTSAVSMNTDSTIAGTLTSAGGVYTLQFFSTPGLDPSGNAEGKTLLGTETVTVMGTSASFTEMLPSGFTPGTYITATATDASGNTSQFSNGVVGTGTGNGVGAPTIVVKASASSVPAGQDVTDTFTITNTNSATDQGVAFSDAIPAGVTFVAGTNSLGGAVTLTGGVASTNIGTLTSGQSATVTIVLMTSAAAQPSFINTGQVTATTPPILPGTDTASVTTAVTPAADLAVVVAGPTGSTLVGQSLTFVVTVTNNGPSPSTGGVLTDVLPAGVSFISATPSFGPTPTPMDGMLVDDYGDLAVGGTFTLRIVVNAGVQSAPQATDSASVLGNEFDPNMFNNSNFAVADITAVADVAVAIVPSATTVGVGQPLVYTVNVANIGPSPATGVMFTDILPAGVMFISATASSGTGPIESGGVVTDTIDSLAAGGLVTFTITVIPTAAGVPTITDNAGVMANEPDPDMKNNAAAVTTAVVPLADVAIDDESVSQSPVTEGDMVQFSFLVADNGPSDATNTVLTDTLPAGLTFVSGNAIGGTVTASGGVVTAPIGTLLAGSTTMVTILVTTTAAGTFSDGASVKSDLVDPMPANNTSSASVTVVAMADLAVVLSGNPGPVYTGDVLTYTAVVTNNGPSAATNVVFADPLPAGFDFISIEGDGSDNGAEIDGNTALLNIASLAPGQSETVVLLVIPTQAGTVVNTATVTATEHDPNLANNASSVSTVLVAPLSLIDFETTSYAVPENAGFATITIARTGDLEGDVTVHFSTLEGGYVIPGVNDATPGVDYIPTSSIVNFPAGVSLETVFVPVLDNPYDNHNEHVQLRLDSPSPLGMAAIAVDGVATLTIVDIDPDLVGPTVTDLKLTGPVSGITAIEVDTTGHLNPSTATNPANYTITALGGGGKTGLRAGTAVPVASAVYNPLTGAVYLFPATPLPGNQVFVIVVNGSRPGAVTDLAGNPLNSVLGVTPGSDYTLSVARGTNITYSDENDDTVNLKLTGPGTIDIDRYPVGDLEKLQVVGGVAGKTVVTGTVHPSRPTQINSILGLGQFGAIRLKMTTPPFYATNLPYPNLATQVDAPAEDTLIPTPPAPPTTKPSPKVKARSVETPGGPASKKPAHAPKVKASATTSEHHHAAKPKAPHAR